MEEGLRCEALSGDGHTADGAEGSDGHAVDRTAAATATPPTGQKAACPRRPWTIASKLFCRRRSSGNLCGCSSLHHDPHPCLGY